MVAIVVDTGIWIAICDPKDTQLDAEATRRIYDRLLPHKLVLPWPVLYETLRTKMVRNRVAVTRLEAEIRRPNVVLLDDRDFRESAIELSFQSSVRGHRPLSAVDCLIRLILEDPNSRIDCLATLNRGDFSDVCHRQGIELWPE